ncbi:MAG: hypothetical protein KAT26_10915 [Marinosulfonomonas sp.]|nr:hypothetical protein [Marinosulfonomonas sp.]
MKQRAIVSAILALFWADAAVAQTIPDVYARIYGNWCGPSHPVDMSRAAPPVDRLDAACMRHDYCVAARGDYDCGCDISLLQELRGTRWGNPVIQGNARAIYDAVALVPCSNPDGTTYKQTLFVVDLLYDFASGKGMPMDVVDRWRDLMFGR